MDQGIGNSIKIFEKIRSWNVEGVVEYPGTRKKPRPIGAAIAFGVGGPGR
jgi:hypothetical protein